MLLPVSLIREQAVTQIMRCNEKTTDFGLSLSQMEAMELVQTRQDALQSNGRIEFGAGVIDKLILKFCDSAYLWRQNYAQTLHELLETFYYFKSESLDLISDDELLSVMKECFENSCRGSVALLQNRELEQLARSLRFGMSDTDRQESPDEYCEEEEPYEQ
jgi:hypothetical protein